MTTPRKERSNRRNLNSQEMHDMVYVDMRASADEDGWAYPDDDDAETTEDYMTRDGHIRNGQRRPRGA